MTLKAETAAWDDVALETPAAPLLVLPNAARPAVYLHPGHLHAAWAPTVITTILGSCVAVCLWDVERGIGGMNHYLLPAGFAHKDASLRFGSVAIPRLIEKILALGCQMRDLRAKVFGGACVLEALRGKSHHLGSQNAELAMELLAQAGIAVVGADTGGQCGRKVIFHTADGTAMVKRL